MAGIFAITTPDPAFDPDKPVRINGFCFLIEELRAVIPIIQADTAASIAAVMEDQLTQWSAAAKAQGKPVGGLAVGYRHALERLRNGDWRVTEPQPDPRDARIAELEAALSKAATRFEVCAGMIAQSFNASGTLRGERTVKAKHYALEALNALRSTNNGENQ